jgi:phospholipid/cholesterol/gamma-HCH transport system substrate-binding protein
MTVARVLAPLALVVAIVVIAILLLTGSGGTTYKLRFINAGQLVDGGQVWVGGRPMGSITDIELTNNNQVLITIEIDDDYAPLHEGTTARIAAQSLSGVANRYIELHPGPQSERELEEGSEIGVDDTETIVDLDQIFDSLNARTRAGLQGIVQGFATSLKDKPKQVNETSKYLYPALSTTQQLIDEATSDERALTGLIVNGASVASAVAQRRADLAGLIGNANTTLQAIAAENGALSQTLDQLPATLRKANTTFVNLRSTLDDLTLLVDASKPATRRLTPFLRDLRPLVADAEPTIRDLRQTIRTPGPDNDLTDLLRITPGLERVVSPASRNTVRALRRSQPVIEFIRPYTPELVGWFRDFGQSATYYDANGHYARVGPHFGSAFDLEQTGGGILDFNPPSNRVPFTDIATRRCPGSASQAPADGSAPYTDGGTLDCDPSEVPPGP